MGMKTILCLLILTAISLPTLSLGQNSQTGDYTFITWQANNYYPSDFIGKAAATNGSTISATVNLVKNKLIQDSSSVGITWYLDGDVLKDGIGLNQVSFRITKTKGSTHILRAEIQTSDGIFSAAASIPIVLPKAVIVAPYPEKIASPNGQIDLEAVPYFFNIKSFGDLSFSWVVNGQEQYGGDDNKLSLTLNPSSAGGLPIAAKISNTKNQFESAQGKIEMSISQ